MATDSVWWPSSASELDATLRPVHLRGRTVLSAYQLNAWIGLTVVVVGCAALAVWAALGGFWWGILWATALAAPFVWLFERSLRQGIQVSVDGVVVRQTLGSRQSVRWQDAEFFLSIGTAPGARGPLVLLTVQSGSTGRATQIAPFYRPRSFHPEPGADATGLNAIWQHLDELPATLNEVAAQIRAQV